MSKSVCLLAGHSFDKRGCSAIIEGKKYDEWVLTTWLVTEIFKRERNKHIDTFLKARNDFSNLVNEVNKHNFDYLISCHFNAYNGKTQGTEVLYSHTSKKGKELALSSLSILLNNLNLPNRGIKPITLKDRGGAILNKTKPIAILIEPFFLDNVKTKKELDLLMEKTIVSVLEILNNIK